jgi:hypothetical protein
MLKSPFPIHAWKTQDNAESHYFVDSVVTDSDEFFPFPQYQLNNPENKEVPVPPYQLILCAESS